MSEPYSALPDKKLDIPAKKRYDISVYIFKKREQGFYASGRKGASEAGFVESPKPFSLHGKDGYTHDEFQQYRLLGDHAADP
jgi:hypothetical protein